MNTIDYLVARRRELKLEKKQAVLNKGEHSVEVYLINEELLSVNSQIRMLTPNCKRVRHSQSRIVLDTNVGKRSESDLQQFRNWLAQDQGDSDDERAKMQQIIHESMYLLTATQRKNLELWCGGLTVTEVGKRFDVSKSTVSRNLGRARSRIRNIAAIRLFVEKSRDGNSLDLSANRVPSFIFATMTENQAACFYLHSVEHITLDKIGSLIGCTKSTVSRSLARARIRLRRILGPDITVLSHVGALENFVYDVYSDIYCDVYDCAPSYISLEHDTCGFLLKTLAKEQSKYPDFNSRDWILGIFFEVITQSRKTNGLN